MFQWRNATSVRRVMLHDHEISWDEHCQWWKKVQTEPGKIILIMLHDGIEVAVVNYFDINREQRSCHWGFYMNPSTDIDNLTRFNIWMEIECAAIDYAFQDLGMISLFCETLLINEHVLQLHKRFGFTTSRHYTHQRDSDTVDIVEMVLKNPNPVVKKNPLTETVQVSFLGSANWDIAAQVFAESHRKISGTIVETLLIPYGQYRSYIHNPDSPLYESEPNFVLFCERLEDFLPSTNSGAEVNHKLLMERFENYLQDIRICRSRLNGSLLVFDLFPLLKPQSFLDENIWSHTGVMSQMSEMNRRLSSLCEELNDCYLLSLSELLLQNGQAHASPGKYWSLAKLPYSHAFYIELSLLLSKWLLAITEKTVRAIIVDLDNTLWQGVIGDDGIDGIVLGSDFPGNLYNDIQRTLQGLQSQGIMLAICSKNTETVAMQAINNHPQMLLRENDFAARRINWQSKSENIRQLADELSLGLNSIMFIDDSPYERASVRQQIPELIIPELPTDPADWPAFLYQHPYLAKLTHNANNLQRGQSLSQRNFEMRKADNYSDITKFWASFETKLAFLPLEPYNQQRIHQLIAKTNQFNMNTVRYTSSQLHELIKSGYQIFGISIEDKFAQKEIAGVLIIEPKQQHRCRIHNLILSCRYLGRGIEAAIYSWLKHKACLQHARQIEIVFKQTERNQPAKESLEQAGFTSTPEQTYSYSLKSSEPLAHWVTYTE